MPSPESPRRSRSCQNSATRSSDTSLASTQFSPASSSHSTSSTHRTLYCRLRLSFPFEDCGVKSLVSVMASAGHWSSEPASRYRSSLSYASSHLGRCTVLFRLSRRSPGCPDAISLNTKQITSNREQTKNSENIAKQINEQSGANKKFGKYWK